MFRDAFDAFEEKSRYNAGEHLIKKSSVFKTVRGFPVTDHRSLFFITVFSDQYTLSSNENDHCH